MKKRISLGLIGCGQRIRPILEGVLNACPEVQLQAIADRDEASIEEYRPLLCESGKSYRDYRGLIENAPDWVFIATENADHAEQVIAALDKGCHVFCEKPLGTSLEDCLAVRDAVQLSGKTFSLGLTLRYSNFYNKIHQLVSSGFIGEILSFEFNEVLDFAHGGYIHGNWRRFRERAGTHILEKCCHDLDLANWITGSVPVRAASFGGLDFFIPENESFSASLGTTKQGKEAYRQWNDRHGVNPFSVGKDIVDNQVVILEFANRARATFHTNCNGAIPERRFYILGSKGSLRGDLLQGQIEVQKIGIDSRRERISFKGVDNHGNGDPVLIKSLGLTMTEGLPPLAGVQEGVASAVAAFGIDTALETGTVVDLLPMWEACGINPDCPLRGWDF